MSLTNVEYQQLIASQMLMNMQNQGGINGSIGQGNSQIYGGPGAISNFSPGAIAAAIYPTQPAKPTPHEGIRLGEIEAWRAWRVQHGFLTAITADLIWAPNEAVHGDTKTHGIYAFKRASEAITYVESWGDLVIGRVALWGEVVEHEDGYRAEWAKPLSIEYAIGKPCSERDLNVIREKYGLPLKAVAPSRMEFLKALVMKPMKSRAPRD